MPNSYSSPIPVPIPVMSKSGADVYSLPPNRTSHEIIFPSKTPHATVPNKSGSPRISISGDISIMLKDSKGFEHLMPSFSNWTKF